jgi:hypothetical protein
LRGALDVLRDITSIPSLDFIFKRRPFYKAHLDLPSTPFSHSPSYHPEVLWFMAEVTTSTLPGVYRRCYLLLFEKADGKRPCSLLGRETARAVINHDAAGKTLEEDYLEIVGQTDLGGGRYISGRAGKANAEYFFRERPCKHCSSRRGTV